MINFQPVQGMMERMENIESSVKALVKQTREMEEKILSIMMENNERLRALEEKIAELSKE